MPLVSVNCERRCALDRRDIRQLMNRKPSRHRPGQRLKLSNKSFVCANLALCCIQKNKQIYHAYKMDKLQLPASLAENLLEPAQQAETLLRKKNLGSITSKSCSEYGFLPRKMWHKMRSLRKLPLRGNNLLLRPSSAEVISDQDRDFGRCLEGRKNKAAQQRCASAAVSLRQLWCPRISVMFVRVFK